MIKNKTHFYKPEMTFDLFDAGLAMYHPNYLVVCDRARQAALSDLGHSFNHMWSQGRCFVVRENTSEYFKPVKMDQEILITTQFVSSKSARLFLTQEILDLQKTKDFPQDQKSGFVDGAVMGSRENLLHRLSIQLVYVNLKQQSVELIPAEMSKLLQID